MKIGGTKLSSPAVSEILVLPRANGPVAFRAKAVMSRDPFDKLCPMPRLPQKTMKGGKKVDDYEHPNFTIIAAQHGTKYQNWMFISGLFSVDPKTHEDVEIEWEMVDRNDPSTYHLWEEELTEAGFSHMERMRIYNMVMEANTLSDTKLTEARNSFLRPEAEEVEPSSSPDSEPNDTPSGEPASDSESDHPASKRHGTSSTKQTGGSKQV